MTGDRAKRPHVLRESDAMIADNDLISMQQARILAENAREAQAELAACPQERLDAMVEAMAARLLDEADALAAMEYGETGLGAALDKRFAIRFVCRAVAAALRPMRCVGALRTDACGQILEVGVPRGVIAAFCPSFQAVATTIYKALLAVKSGNAILFALHPACVASQGRAVELLAEAAHGAGLPEGCLAALTMPAKNGARELMNHPAVSLVLLTGVDGLLDMARKSGKPLICGSTGSGPAFIDRSADLEKAVRDIVFSKTFDCGLAPAAEQCVVVDAPVADAARALFARYGAWFMSGAESEALAALLFHPDGRRRRDMMGLPARTLARRAGFAVPDGTRVLVAERHAPARRDPYNRELLNPVLAWYVEDDWMAACARCIELLLENRTGHSLVVHARDDEVVRQYALKKPVARLLVNTPACLGGMGATTDLFPALTLGSGQAGHGMTADNISPMNLVFVRKVGYGRDLAACLAAIDGCRPEGAFGAPLPAWQAAGEDRAADRPNASAATSGQDRLDRLDRLGRLEQALQAMTRALSDGSR